jgi:hypothetical protein
MAKRRTDNTMTKRRTDNTMTKRKSTNNDLQNITQKDRQYNGQKKKGQTMIYKQKDRQYNDQKKEYKQ